LAEYLKYKLPDRNQSDKRFISELLTEIRNHGINDYKNLNSIIDQNYAWLLEHEKSLRTKMPKLNYNVVGVVRVIIRHIPLKKSP
jgi:hypothetical protein